MGSCCSVGVKLSYAGRVSSRELLYNIELVVNRIILYTLKFLKRVDLLLSVLTTKPNQTRPNQTKPNYTKPKTSSSNLACWSASDWPSKIHEYYININGCYCRGGSICAECQYKQLANNCLSVDSSVIVQIPGSTASPVNSRDKAWGFDYICKSQPRAYSACIIPWWGCT